MAQQIQLRGGTASEWSTANPILATRELGLETGTNKYKVGDGVTRWNSLPYGGVSLAGTLETDLDVNILASEPSTPLAGRLKLYAKAIANRPLLKIMSSTGYDVALQPSFFGNAIRSIFPNTGTTFSVFNWVTPTAVGTVSHPAIAAGGFRVGCRRVIVTSAASANSASELRQAAYDVLRGDVAKAGGFHLSTTFAVETAVANQRLAIGLFSTVGAISTTQSPSALTNCIFVGWDSTDTSLQIMTNDATGTCTKVALSATDFPANSTTNVYQFDLFAAPNDTVVGWQVKNLNTDVVTSGIINADLPASNTLLAWHAHMNNGGTASAVVMAILRVYLETDT